MSEQRIHDVGAEWALDCALKQKERGDVQVSLPATMVERLMTELFSLRKQVALDADSRKASQAEFARLNRELNEARNQIDMLRGMAGLPATGD